MEPERGGGRRLLPEDGVRDISRRPEGAETNSVPRATELFIPIPYDGGPTENITMITRPRHLTQYYKGYGSDDEVMIAMIEWLL
jgi:hypothetical protein